MPSQVRILPRPIPNSWLRAELHDFVTFRRPPASGCIWCGNQYTVRRACAYVCLGGRLCYCSRIRHERSTRSFRWGDLQAAPDGIPMPANIEIKARARDFRQQQQIAASLATSAVEVLDQFDTFYRVPRGRLKLRQSRSRIGELIFYEREDVSGPRRSTYS